jgi:hypothetical protein
MGASTCNRYVVSQRLATRPNRASVWVTTADFGQRPEPANSSVPSGRARPGPLSGAATSVGDPRRRRVHWQEKLRRL